MEKTHNDKGFYKLGNPFLIYMDNIATASADIGRTYVEDITHSPPRPLGVPTALMPPVCSLCPPEGLMSCVVLPPELTNPSS